MGATQGSTDAGHKAEGEGGTGGKRLYCDFHEKEQTRPGKQA